MGTVVVDGMTNGALGNCEFIIGFGVAGDTGFMGGLLLGMVEGNIRAMIWAGELVGRQIGSARQLRSCTGNDGKNSGDRNVNRRIWKSGRRG